MTEISPIVLGQQLMKPSGEIGLEVAAKMNTANIQIYDFVLSHMQIKDNNSILEIGIGNGKFINKYFQLNKNIEVSAIDFSETMCSEATIINKELIDNGKLLIKCEDSSGLSFQDDCFDQITAINTVYFWKPINNHLREIYRVLKAGGQLLIGFRPKSVMQNLPFAQEVFMHYEPEELKSILKENGFREVREEKLITYIKAVDGSNLEILDNCLIAQK